MSGLRYSTDDPEFPPRSATFLSCSSDLSGRQLLMGFGPITLRETLPVLDVLNYPYPCGLTQPLPGDII